MKSPFEVVTDMNDYFSVAQSTDPLLACCPNILTVILLAVFYWLIAH
jgi:hypothetical protein